MTQRLELLNQATMQSVSSSVMDLAVVSSSALVPASRLHAYRRTLVSRLQRPLLLGLCLLALAVVSSASDDAVAPSLIEASADASTSAHLAVELTQPCGISSSFSTSNQCCGNMQCPYTNGVCCGSGTHCCPAGAVCLPPAAGSSSVRCGIHSSAITPSANVAAAPSQPANAPLRDISVRSVPVEVCPCANQPASVPCPCAGRDTRVEAEVVKGACAGGASCNPNDVLQLVQPEIVSRSADTFMKPAQVKRAPAPIVEAQNGVYSML